MIFGLVSTFDEGALASDAVRSLLPCCQSIRVLDGPIGDVEGAGFGTDWKPLLKTQRVIVNRGRWETDAAKRTELIQSLRRFTGPVWAIILDGDELLLYGEQVPSWINYFEAEAAFRSLEPLRCPIRLVDGDGTTSVMTGRILRADLVERYITSSYHILLRNGTEVALGNGKLRSFDEPDSGQRDTTTGLQLRRPLQGEPSILHRSHLRPPQRQAQRQSVAEKSDWETLAQGIGGEVQDTRVPIWLPS